MTDDTAGICQCLLNILLWHWLLPPHPLGCPQASSPCLLSFPWQVRPPSQHNPKPHLSTDSPIPGSHLRLLWRLTTNTIKSIRGRFTLQGRGRDLAKWLKNKRSQNSRYTYPHRKDCSHTTLCRERGCQKLLPYSPEAFVCVCFKNIYLFDYAKS